ncbi:MAG TPA: CTP--2,3-di-O-geranylgeranyl-sn-glycero-1-phosphate cytidyltransferase [Candidatus Nanoarchaeia archaeon]|nr:CTP--2,3-di-O-geranylgeranyl-sn-glycero-1-phosphate cytidyltransferase [Candidatus Nanoarchaeia archaeon]
MPSPVIVELRKKSFQFFILLIAGLYFILAYSVSRKIALLVLVFILLLFLFAEYLRLELNMQIPWMNRILKAKEERRMHSGVYFMLSTIICLAVFDARIAVAALMMSIFGGLAAAIGGRFGKTLLFRDKSLIGSASELGVNILFGLMLLSNAYIILAMAFTATIAEVLVTDLEDNLFVPLFSGFLGQLIFLL